MFEYIIVHFLNKLSLLSALKRNTNKTQHKCKDKSSYTHMQMLILQP